jgi:hypothetical protein
MDNQSKIQFAIGASLVAAGLVIEFTLHTDATRVAGAVIATLGVIVARRAFRKVRWGGRK